MLTPAVCLHALSQRYPDKAAVVDQDGQRSTAYGQLDSMAARVARLLTNAGVKEGDAVPILLPRDRRYVAALFGVFRIGAAPVPLDPSYPPERLSYIRQDCSSPLTVDEGFMEEAMRQEPLQQVVQPAGKGRALITYTSGSTGKPKGVVQSWDSLMAGLKRIEDISDVCATDVIACTAPFSFIALMLDLLTPLTVGATVHILSNEQRKDIRRISDYIADHQISGIFISPQLLKNFNNRSSSLRYVLTGSERVSMVQPDAYQLYNIYGMSEIPLTISVFPVDKAYENTPIGTAVSGLEIILLGDMGVPDEEGEICVAGDVFLGYLNLPEATERAFSEINGKRFFHTGDLARRLPDGNLEYINRKDWMVKVNGQRVEPGEIEHAMASCPGVSTAVVKSFENEQGQTFLCGYYVAREPVEEGRLRSCLKDLVPDYMVPQFLVHMDTFPLNANGKIDRLSLVKPDVSSYQAAYIPPENDAQQQLCAAFETLLSLERVGIHDDFFALGGDSIKAVRLQGLCPSLPLEVMDIFEGRTPEGIAQRLDARGISGAKEEDVFAGCSNEPMPSLLTESQMGIYLACMGAPDSTMYNIPCRFRFPREAGIDTAHLLAAIRHVVDSYPVFRTKLGLLDGEPALVPDASIPCDIPVKEALEEEIRSHERSFVQPFDLSSGPLFRFEVACTAEAVHLFMDVHHLIFDGASMAVFLQQLARAYAGEPLHLEAVNAFALSRCERRTKETADLQAAHDYFATLLGGVEVDSLPITDHSPAPDAAFAPAQRIARDLPSLSITSTERFVQKAGITEGTFFLAAFAYTLAKFTGQTESLFCTVNNGRHDARLDNTIGMLVRTLPVYVRFDEQHAIADTLRTVQQQFFQSMHHDGYPFSMIASEFGIKPDILYVYQAETLNGIHLRGQEARLEVLETGCALSKLSVMVFRRGEGYALSIDYQSDLYDASTMERLVSLFETVLNGFLSCRIFAQIPLLGAGDLAVYEQVNRTESPYDSSLSLVDLLRAQAARTPENTAVAFRDIRLSYRDLDMVTDRLAAHIQKLGISQGDVVSVLIPRDQFMPIASIGASKAGAAYQPLDPAYPPERLSFMIQDAGAKLLIADESLVGLLPGYEGPVLFTKDIASLPQEALAHPGPGPEDLFILLYTSGTTGQPKGCMIEHGSLVAFCHWYCRHYALDERSRVTAYASYGFDANMMDMYPALVSGGTVYIIPDEIRLELNKLNEYFRANGITHGFMTTQVARQYVMDVKDHALQYLSMGGEKLTPFDPPKDLRLFNLYGPTESTILATAFEIDKLYSSVPIGKPLDNLKVYVVDGQGRQVPVGVPGELLVSGRQVARGYLNRPEQTEKVFIPNPFCDEEGYRRMYRTGDIVRLLPNGNVEFVGRRDFQVKIRGYRIELTEVEAAIRQFPDIQNATVVAQDAPAGGKQIVAYIVSPTKIDIPSLNAFILSHKPPYMVPAATMQIDAIPLNVNGKVDKRKLPAIEAMAPVEEDTGHVLNLLEERIFEAIRDVMGQASFSPTMNLMTAGLTSLSAVRLATLLHERLGHGPDVKKLLTGCSVLDIENDLIAHYLENARPSLPPSDTETADRYPLTQTQIGIYLACERSGGDVYNIPMLFALPDDLDMGKLTQALRQAVDAHPGMRCSIEADQDGNLCMVPRDGLEWQVQHMQLSEQELKERIDEGFSTAFQLDTAPLFAFKMITTPQQRYLLLDIHHIIADGASMGILFQDISRAYAGEKLTKEPYSAFHLALDEAEGREGKAYQEARAYHDRIFQGVTVNSLPEGDLPGNVENSNESRSYEQPVAGLTPQAVDAYCKKHQLTPNALFTAAFAYTLARWKNDQEALFTVIYNGRTDPRTASTIGMLVKTLPLYVQLDAQQSVSAYVSGVKDSLTGLMAHDLYSFAEISSAYGIRPDIIFAYQGDIVSGLPIAGLMAERIPLSLQTAKAPLNIDVFKEGNSYHYVWEYRADLYSEGLIARLADAAAATVTNLLTAETLGALRITSTQALATIAGFNDTAWPVQQKPAYRLLEEQALRTPDRIAVIANNEKLSYRQLNQKANRVANRLIEEGVQPNTLVGVMMGRCAAVYIARQSILKAGGAFICIDPEYPDDRVAYIIENSGLLHLLVSRDLLESRSALWSRQRIAVHAVDDLLAAGIDTNPGVSVQPDDLCYCIYTSGSTGRPKGVKITQRNLVNFVDANPRNPEILGYTQFGTVSLALASITFDVSIMEEFIPLAHGLTICMANEEQIHNPLALSQLMLEHKVDIMTCTPSFLSNIIDLPQLRQALARIASYDFGAEAFPAALYDKICAIRPDAYIMNGYGPSETTISCTMSAINSSDCITIGKPAANVQAQILDDQGNALPVGALGELVICGEGVGAGYIGLDELTREKFITINGLKAYRTGDLAQWSPDGDIVFHGRIDNQVKLRGLRVELGEIESTINAFPGVSTSIVVMKGPENDRFLAGYFTADKRIDVDKLHTYLAEKLTHYMVPGVLMQLDAMPLTANRKIDKKALPEVHSKSLERAYVAPASDLEHSFCQLFEQTLSLEKVGATDNFFEIGGTSLSASKVVMFAMTKGYALTYADMFKLPTPRQLAQHVAGDLASEKSAGQKADATELAEDFDYSSLDAALEGNRLENVDAVTFGDAGDILLTGATGFLGIHILYEFLQNNQGIAYCLVRKGRFESPGQRLKSMLVYYFDQTFEELLDTRIVCLDGDITDADFVSSLESIPFDTLINCAALVKHFSADDALERINVKGVQNIIELCRKAQRRLVQVSTVSIAGEGKNESPPPDKRISEGELFFGQALDNAYIRSKFLAEREVLSAAADGLDVRIMRVGNLMSRARDGEFQINFLTNGFMRQLRGYRALEVFPLSAMNMPVEFSPIDATSRAILHLAGAEGGFTVFHPYNNHVIYLSDVIDAMNRCDLPIRVVPDEAFESHLHDALADPEKSGMVSGLIAYLSDEAGGKAYMLDADNRMTTEVLYRAGFKWPITGDSYLAGALHALDGLGFFE